MASKKDFAKSFANNPAMQFMSGMLQESNSEDEVDALVEEPSENSPAREQLTETETETETGAEKNEASITAEQGREEAEALPETAPADSVQRAVEEDEHIKDTMGKVASILSEDRLTIRMPHESPVFTQRETGAPKVNRTDTPLSKTVLRMQDRGLYAARINETKRSERFSIALTASLLEKVRSFSEQTTSSVGRRRASVNDTIIALIEFAFAMELTPELLERVKAFQDYNGYDDIGKAIEALVENSLSEWENQF